MHQITLRSAVVTALIIASGVGVLGVASAAGSTTDPAPVGAVGDKRVQLIDRSSTQGLTEQYTSSAAAGQFTAITPYRAYDSRVNETDKIRRGDDFNIDMLTDFQSVPRIPSNATAITFNVTVTETESTFGFVTIFNGDATVIPGTSTINWVLPNFTIANGGAVALGGPGVSVGTIGLAMDGNIDAAAEVIVDVTGYYTP